MVALVSDQARGKPGVSSDTEAASATRANKMEEELVPAQES